MSVSPAPQPEARSLGPIFPVDPSPATESVAYLSVEQLLSALGQGDLSSAEVVQTLIRRIEEIDRPGTPVGLRSVLAVNERAVDEARTSDRRRANSTELGALEGVPVLVKDNIEVAGLPSTAGATSLAGRPPARDAELVARIRRAGAVVLGTTNLSEWANIRSPRSSAGWSAVGGLTGNPWALDRSAGGSSSGSGAALAAGLAPLSVGTETDGSITCPASLNGVAGIKPAVGSVPVQGVVPISASQDSPGPMGRRVADVTALLDVLTGWPTALRPADIRVGVARTWLTGHPGTDELVGRAVGELRTKGLTVVDVEAALPTPQVEDDELTVLLCELKDGMDAYLPTRGPGGPQSLAEVMAHELGHPESELTWFGHELFERAMGLGGCDTDAYRAARARNLEWALGACLEPASADVDMLVAPTYGPAWKSDLVLGGHPAAAAPITTAPAIAGWPIATVPVGLASGLPVGLGLVGRPGTERLLLAVGALIEQPMRPAWRPPERG